MLRAISAAPEQRAPVGQRAKDMLGPWQSYRKPGWTHGQNHHVLLPGMCTMFLTLFLKKDSLGWGRVLRNAININNCIKGSKRWWQKRTRALLGKDKTEEQTFSHLSGGEVSYGYNRRLRAKSTLPLSIATTRVSGEVNYTWIKNS